MAPITSEELLRRARALDAHLAASGEDFERPWPLDLGAPESEAEIASVEAELGIAVPEPWRGLLLRHGSGRLCYALSEELEEELDADTCGANGGFEVLSAAQMREQHARILAYGRLSKDTAPKLVPLVKSPNAATWMVVLETERGVRIAHVHHDQPLSSASLAGVDAFFDQWSRGGFRTEGRWEDQPEPVVDRFCVALGLDGHGDRDGDGDEE